MSSRTQEYAVRYLHDIMKMDSNTIAKELKLKITEVNKILSIENSEPQKPKKITSKDLMINETSAKRNKNVSIMTEAASQMNDELVKNLNKSSRTQNYIFRPKD